MKTIKKFNDFINETVNNFNELKVIKTTLNSNESQEVLNKHIDDLPIFKEIVEKGMSMINRNIELYYDGDEFVGYIIYTFDYFIFDKNKNPIETDDEDSVYKTLHINDIEIRDSIRKDSSNPRYGKMILDNIINVGKKYDGITLQANNDKLLTDVYPKYGFVNMNFGGNGMVKWN